MYERADSSCDCVDDVLSIYREKRAAGQRGPAAYTAALHEFERRHPEAGVFEAMAAVKEALASERDLGLVDSGDARLG